MRAVVQRVSEASVSADGKITGKIQRGFLILLGVTHQDTLKQAKYLAEKCCALRIFPDNEGKLNLSLSDIRGEILAVSQFTLYGNCKKGNRPNFMQAAGREQAEELYLAFVEQLNILGVHTETGVFGADMKVTLVNDGPVTLLVDTDGESEWNAK